MMRSFHDSHSTPLVSLLVHLDNWLELAVHLHRVIEQNNQGRAEYRVAPHHLNNILHIQRRLIVEHHSRINGEPEPPRSHLHRAPIGDPPCDLPPHRPLADVVRQLPHDLLPSVGPKVLLPGFLDLGQLLEPAEQPADHLGGLHGSEVDHVDDDDLGEVLGVDLGEHQADLGGIAVGQEDVLLAAEVVQDHLVDHDEVQTVRGEEGVEVARPAVTGEVEAEVVEGVGELGDEEVHRTSVQGYSVTYEYWGVCFSSPRFHCKETNATQIEENSW